MGYLNNAMKSSYILLNFGKHKSVRYTDGQNDEKIYTISSCMFEKVYHNRSFSRSNLPQTVPTEYNKK
jgi:hypothetical protein